MTEDLGSLLVVDDDAMNRDMLSRRLQRRGYAVEVVADGRSVLKRIAEQQYDLRSCRARVCSRETDEPGTRGYALG